MQTGILIIVASVVLIGIATWMHSRDEDDGEGKVVWSIVQLACAIAILYGAYMVYSNAVNPPKPPTDGPGFN